MKDYYYILHGDTDLKKENRFTGFGYNPDDLVNIQSLLEFYKNVKR